MDRMGVIYFHCAVYLGGMAGVCGMDVKKYHEKREYGGNQAENDKNKEEK